MRSGTDESEQAGEAGENQESQRQIITGCAEGKGEAERSRSGSNLKKERLKRC